jgi:hypothetical protein
MDRTNHAKCPNCFKEIGKKGPVKVRVGSGPSKDLSKEGKRQPQLREQ